MVNNRSANNVPFKSPEITDELKRIKGIGQGVETRLYEAGIHSFSQLAALSPQRISKILTGMIGMSAEKIKEQDWIGQASQLALEAKSDEAFISPINLDERQRYETFSVKLLVDEGNQVRRTNIVHVQKGVEENWAGWNETRLIAFVVENAALNVSTSKATIQMDVESIPATAAEAASSPSEMTETTAKHKQKHLHRNGTLTINGMDILEKGSVATSSVIATDQDWSIRLAWSLSKHGPLFGNWLVKAYLESIGPGKEYVLPNDEGVRLSLMDGEMKSPNLFSYSNELNFKAGEIEPGIYWLVVTIAWEKHSGKLGNLMSFSEKSMVQFYKR